MKINEIIGKSVKIGKTSITVKGEKGKTYGIVTNIKTAATLSARDKFDFRNKTGLGIEFLNSCVNCNGDWYYINDIRKMQNLENNISRLEGTSVDVSSDKKNFAKLQEMQRIASERISVIDCYVL